MTIGDYSKVDNNDGVITYAEAEILLGDRDRCCTTHCDCLITLFRCADENGKPAIECIDETQGASKVLSASPGHWAMGLSPQDAPWREVGRTPIAGRPASRKPRRVKGGPWSGPRAGPADGRGWSGEAGRARSLVHRGFLRCIMFSVQCIAWLLSMLCTLFVLLVGGSIAGLCAVCSNNARGKGAAKHSMYANRQGWFTLFIAALIGGSRVA